MQIIFPILLIIESIAAAGIYAWMGDWRMCTYWLAAAILTICVTF